MRKSRIFELTSLANTIADVHAFEENLSEPKRSLEDDIKMILTPEEWSLIQVRYEDTFLRVKQSMQTMESKNKRMRS
jgi:hypothetical protein